jgi:hypothetical protein
MNFFKRRQILKATNFLDLIPMRIQGHRMGDDGLVNIIIPKFGNQRFARWFIPLRKPTQITIKLEKFGSSSWLLMDGKRSMQEICDILLQEYGDEIQPVTERMSKYVSLLYHQDHVTFAQLIKTDK